MHSSWLCFRSRQKLQYLVRVSVFFPDKRRCVLVPYINLYFILLVLYKLLERLEYSTLYMPLASQAPLVVKNPPASARDTREVGLIPESGRSSGERNGNTLQYFCLGNPMDRGGWWATVHWMHRVGHDWSNFAHRKHKKWYQLYHLGIVFDCKQNPDPEIMVWNKLEVFFFLLEEYIPLACLAVRQSHKNNSGQ